MMENKPIKIMRADIDLGGCVLRAYRDDANHDVVVIVPDKNIDIMTLGLNGPEDYYAKAGAHVVVNRSGLESAIMYIMVGKEKRAVNLFSNYGDVRIMRTIQDEMNVCCSEYDVEVKPDTPLYSHDDCERTSEYDKVCSLLTQAETR